MFCNWQIIVTLNYGMAVGVLYLVNNRYFKLWDGSGCFVSGK